MLINSGLITRLKKHFKISYIAMLIKKKALYLSVNVFSTKVLLEDTIFMSPTGDGTAILCGHPSLPKVLSHF